jgi:hypothetical protein
LPSSPQRSWHSRSASSTLTSRSSGAFSTVRRPRSPPAFRAPDRVPRGRVPRSRRESLGLCQCRPSRCLLRSCGSCQRLWQESGKQPLSRRGGNKNLKRVFYQAAFASLRSSPESRAFYHRKRAEGKRHIQALIALTRRRVNVIWAMLRDGTTFETRSAT